MSLFQRLTRNLRPTMYSKTPPTKSMPITFFSSHANHRPRLGHRLYSSWNQFNNGKNAAQNINLMYSLMGLNVGVWTYGYFLQTQARQGYPGPASSFMRNTTLNFNEFFYGGRWWTAVTSVFNHSGILHLGFNMLSTYYLGGMVASIPGITPVRFLTIVLGSGICGSLGFLAQRYNTIKDPRRGDNVRGLGFSGAVTGLGVVAAFVYPRTKMMLYGIIPAPLWALMLGFVAYDGYYMNDSNSRIAHAGHLGGAAFGAMYFLLRMRRGF